MNVFKRTIPGCLVLFAVSACGPSPQPTATTAAPATSPAAATGGQTPKYNTRIPEKIMTPDTVETRIGTLKFVDGVPSLETTQKVYDNLDFLRGVPAELAALKPRVRTVSAKEQHRCVAV